MPNPVLTPATTPDGMFDMAAAPMRIAAVELRVRDLAVMSAFYRAVIGLEELERAPGAAGLGAGGRVLLRLHEDRAFTPLDPRQAGLYHTAFLLPTRADLGRWLVHAAALGATLQGASDHLVSEALYLADPEGNGIEIYADRPLALWQAPPGAVRMASEALDLKALMAEAAGTSWQGFPAQGCIGHVHLQAGDLAAADGFFREVLGFDIATRYPGASFYGSGGYHHQLAANIWHSRGAGPRPGGMSGLKSVEIAVTDHTLLARIAAAAGDAAGREGAALILRDPWGSVFRLVAEGG